MSAGPRREKAHGTPWLTPAVIRAEAGVCFLPCLRMWPRDLFSPVGCVLVRVCFPLTGACPPAMADLYGTPSVRNK